MAFTWSKSPRRPGLISSIAHRFSTRSLSTSCRRLLRWVRPCRSSILIVTAGQTSTSPTARPTASTRSTAITTTGRLPKWARPCRLLMSIDLVRVFRCRLSGGITITTGLRTCFWPNGGGRSSFTMKRAGDFARSASKQGCLPGSIRTLPSGWISMVTAC